MTGFASGVTSEVLFFVAVDDTDGVTRETGLATFTVYRARGTNAAAAMTTPTIAELDATNMPGVYSLALDEDMTVATGKDLQEMVFHITHAGMRPVSRVIEIQRIKFTAGQTSFMGNSGINVEQWDGSAVNALVSGRVDASVGAVAANAITATSIAADAITAAKVAADVHAEAADANWDEARSGHVAAGSFGEALQVTRTGTAQAGANGSITLDTGASATNDIYIGQVIAILSGTGADQSRIITDYNGTTKAATVLPIWVTNPSTDSVFIIRPYGPADVELWKQEAPNALVSGNLHANVATISLDATAANNLEALLDGTGGVTLSGDLSGSIGSLATQAKADVNAEVVDALNTDTYAEPSGVPAATASVVTKIGYLHMALRNQVTITATKMTFFDDGGAAEWEKDLSDDGTTYTETESNAI
jgi:hypothetical protein